MRDHVYGPEPVHPPEILQAFFRNQERWLERLSTGETEPTLPHTRIRHDESVTTVRTGRSGVMCLNLHDPDSIADLPAVERAQTWLRYYGQQDVLVWSLLHRPRMELSLLGRGFELSFRPMWMARSLAGALPSASARGVEIRIASEKDIDELSVTRAIPYLVPDQVETTRTLAMDRRARAVTWLVARDRSGIVGQAIVNLTGETAGLYNVAVHPQARRRGIGRALTTVAMEVAFSAGARRMALNATPEGIRLYLGLGFRHLGEGMTWYLPSRRTRTVPHRAHVALAEAIGAGRIDDIDPDALPSHLPNGDLPMTFAARFGQKETVRWLLEQGADADILALVDAGFSREAAWAMEDPVAVNRPSGPTRATPLHHAIERGNIALAEMLIAAGADLTARDAMYRSTPLGWSMHFNRPEIAGMIRRAGGV